MRFLAIALLALVLPGAARGAPVTLTESTVADSCRHDLQGGVLVAAWETRATNARNKPESRNCLIVKEGAFVYELSSLAGPRTWRLIQRESIPVAALSRIRLMEFYDFISIDLRGTSPTDALWHYTDQDDVRLDDIRLDFEGSDFPYAKSVFAALRTSVGPAVAFENAIPADRIDFTNFTYPAIASCFPGKIPPSRMALRDGYFSVFDPLMGLGIETHVEQIAVGTFAGSKRAQVAVLLECTASIPIGYYNEAFLYDRARGTASLIARLAGGSETDGITDLRFENGQLLVDRCLSDATGTCTYTAVTHYAWDGRRLRIASKLRHPTGKAF